MTSSKSNWNKSEPTRLLKFPNKRLRAYVVGRYIVQAAMLGVVVFTCGNAAEALRNEIQGVVHGQHSLPQVVEVGPNGDLKTDKWWSPAEIHRAWPHLFDATSGHLPLPMMRDIAKVYKDYFATHSEEIEGCEQFYVPSGSGETIICLQIAFPDKKFCAVYDNSNIATTRDADAPLNDVVDALFPVEYWNGVLHI